MKSKLFLVVLSVLLITALGVGTAISANIVGLRAVDPTIVNPDGVIEIPEIDTTFDVELFLDLDSDISANGITGFTVDILWDPLVAYESSNKGSLYTTMDVTDNAPEQIELNGYNFGDAIAEDHVLATLSLRCIGLGWTELLPVGHFEDAINIALADGTYLENLGYEGITINQVPIPGTVLLFGSGLLGLMGIGRRRMKKS